MKKIFITSIAAFSLLSACKDKTAQGNVDYAVISGKVFLPGESQKIVLAHNDEIYKEIPVLSDGTFRDTIRPITDNHFFYLIENMTVQVPLYLDKGTNIELSLNEDITKTTVSGTETKKTQYLIEKENFINEKINGADSNLFGQKPQEFKENIKSIFNELDSKLKAYNFDNDFVENQQKWAKYKYVEYLIAYPTYHAYSIGKEAILPDGFYAERDQIDYDNAQEYAAVDSYRDLVRSKYFEMLRDASNPEQIEGFLKVASSIKSDNIRTDLAKAVVSLIAPGNSKNKEILDFVLKNVKEDDLKQVAQKSFEVASRLVAGKDSPVFTNYEKIDGGTASLADFKGKLVYIDVWASWCKPCVGEIPHLKELEAKFHGKNIEFVSISIDEDKEAWKSAVKAHDLKGVQLIADNAFKSQFILDYDINQIPTFLLIDKNGKIVDPNAPRPSDPRLAEVLEKLLK
ncbi:TlpA family protein disulfide reductase [Capnocytophaga gingivalis]|jgi:alkyl hydroperoxide reductase/ thiol specific antioxidant/ mal allergen|uniref:TlpA family protein disulfide reductase n=1 Tax=Capnocytophaga gingivalis TaxID=1017 RepID=UPI0028D47414|nr:TlpA disulfide reductase family protein [Capnocytophaga gingivalis]